MGVAEVGAAVNPAILTFVGILVFTSGLVVGYITGWDHGVQRGFGVGWREAMSEVRRIIARTKGAV